MKEPLHNRSNRQRCRHRLRSRRRRRNRRRSHLYHHDCHSSSYRSNRWLLHVHRTPPQAATRRSQHCALALSTDLMMSLVAWSGATLLWPGRCSLAKGMLPMSVGRARMSHCRSNQRSDCSRRRVSRLDACARDSIKRRPAAYHATHPHNRHFCALRHCQSSHDHHNHHQCLPTCQGSMNTEETCRLHIGRRTQAGRDSLVA